MPNQKGFAPPVIFIFIIVLASAGIFGGSIYYAKSTNKGIFTSKNNNLNSGVSLPSKHTSTTKEIPTNNTEMNVKNSDIYKPGLYINPKLNLVFNYPENWILSKKYIDKKDNLSIYLDSSNDLISRNILSIEVKKGADKELLQYAQNPEAKWEEKTIGTLKGYFHSELSEILYLEKFIAIYKNISFEFTLQTNPKDQNENRVLFNNLISSVKGYDKTSYKIPEYLNDNLALDEKISTPSYVTSGFSFLEEEQEPNLVKWAYALNVTESVNGPTDLIIDEKKIGSESYSFVGTQMYSYVVNLENILQEINKYYSNFILNSSVEPITLQGYKGYYIIKKVSYDGQEKDFGYLIFETDKVVVTITAGYEADASKDELIKIARSMFH